MLQWAYSRRAGNVGTSLLCSLAFSIGLVAGLPLLLAEFVVIVFCGHARVRWSPRCELRLRFTIESQHRDAQDHVTDLCLVSHAVLEGSAVRAAERRICRALLSSYSTSRLAKSRGNYTGRKAHTSMAHVWADFDVRLFSDPFSDRAHLSGRWPHRLCDITSSRTQSSA